MENEAAVLSRANDHPLICATPSWSKSVKGGVSCACLPQAGVTTRIVYGSKKRIAGLLHTSPVSTTISTYGVERNNLTVRQHSRRMGRKVNAFSKDHDYLEHQLTLAFAYYHFVVPHRSLRQRLPRPVPTKGPRATYKKWKPVTPAMAADLTDHVWSTDELLSLRVPPKHLW